MSSDSNSGKTYISELALKLSEQAQTRMHAETVAFLASFIPARERCREIGPREGTAFAKELTLHYFDMLAREMLAVSHSVEEYEAALLRDVPGCTHHILRHHPLLADGNHGDDWQEISEGISAYCSGVDIALLPEVDRENLFLYVGGVVSEALHYSALQWQARAWKLAVDGALAKEPIIHDSMFALPAAESAHPGTTKTARSLRSATAAQAVADFIDKKCLTQTEFAQMARISERTLRDFLRTGSLSKRNIVEVAAAMGVNVDKLTGEREQ